MKSHQKFEIVHSDMCGPFEVKYLGGTCYFLTFIDEFTRNFWIYFLKKKSDFFRNFKKFNLLVEKQIENTVKRLRTDGGGEYTLVGFA